jgi:hypothetical protein
VLDSMRGSRILTSSRSECAGWDALTCTKRAALLIKRQILRGPAQSAAPPDPPKWFAQYSYYIHSNIKKPRAYDQHFPV